MNMDQLSTSEQKPSPKIPVEQISKEKIMATWKTLDTRIQKLALSNSREIFEEELKSEKFSAGEIKTAILFRRLLGIDKRQKKDASGTNQNNDDITSLLDETKKTEKLSKAETPEILANPEKMRIATLTQAIKEKLLLTQKPLAEKITSLLMDNGFDFIERQVTITTRDTTTETPRFIIFLDPHKIEEWKTKFTTSDSATFDKAVRSFAVDFKKFQQKNDQTDGLKIAFNTRVLKDSTGAGWNLASQEDAEAILTYLRDNDKLNGRKPTSYAMYMDPKRARGGNFNMISVGLESGTFILRLQDAYTEPKHEQEVVFWATPVLTIDMKQKVKINPSPTTEPQKTK